jgi:hypothetical protein
MKKNGLTADDGSPDERDEGLARKDVRRNEAIRAETKVMRDKIMEVDRGTVREEVKPKTDEMMACRETMKAHLEEKEPTSLDRKPETAEQKEEFPVEDATVMPVREPKRKRHRDRNLAAGRCQKSKDMTREGVDPRRDWPSPAEGRHTVRKWHGRRKTLFGETALWPWLSEQPREQDLSGRIY